MYALSLVCYHYTEGQSLTTRASETTLSNNDYEITTTTGQRVYTAGSVRMVDGQYQAYATAHLDTTELSDKEYSTLLAYGSRGLFDFFAILEDITSDIGRYGIGEALKASGWVNITEDEYDRITQ